MVEIVVRRFALLMALVLASLLTLTPNADASRRDVELESFGRPIWKPVDCHLVSAEIGTAGSGYAEYFETLQSLLPPPRHVPIEALGIGPGLRITRPTAPSRDEESPIWVSTRDVASARANSRMVKESSSRAWSCRDREREVRPLTSERAGSFPISSSRSMSKEPPFGIAASSTRTSTSRYHR